MGKVYLKKVPDNSSRKSPCDICYFNRKKACYRNEKEILICTDGHFHYQKLSPSELKARGIE
jgi:hypothetical protein